MQADLFLKKQLELYPYMQAQDALKYCFQAAFGPEHLIKSPEDAKVRFENELAGLQVKKGELIEKLSNSYSRIHLAPMKAFSSKGESLFSLFLMSAQGALDPDADQNFEKLTDHVGDLAKAGSLPFSDQSWKRELRCFREAGHGAPSHSTLFREKAHPAYRLISNRYLQALEVLMRLEALNARAEVKVVAIEGRAAAGKSSLAAVLSQVLDGGLIHMDDFYLPMEIRSSARLSEPGGNVHYERFQMEILPKIRSAQAFEYRRFDCGSQNYTAPRLVKAGEWRIVEGAYSLHPALGDYADFKVFYDISPERQKERILARNGETTLKVFSERWIPMEERYFQACKCAQKLDLIIRAGDDWHNPPQTSGQA